MGGAEHRTARERLGGEEDDRERRSREDGDGGARRNRDLCGETGDHADRLGDARRGHRDEVGGDRGERQPVEPREQHGRRPGLRAERHRRGEAQRSRPGQPLGDPRRGHEHACGGEHAEDEPELAGEHRVDEQQQEHRHGEDVAGVPAASEQTGAEDEPGHDARAQHRRLPAHEHRIPGHRDEPDPAAAAGADAEQGRETEDPAQQEGDVPPRDDDEVGEARGGELLGALR